MPDTITLILIVIAAIAGASIVWFALRRNLPPAAAQDVAEAVAYVKDILRGVVTEAEVKAVATWLYRTMKTGAQYYTEQQFVDLVTRAIMRGLENQSSIAAMVQADSALEATRNTARTIPNRPEPHIQRLA